ncbi:PadR family transcriptional regulator [Streptomyces boninensis]|uniref:PadR family transcriptional regulator n=1 Tax=Streptomyces boninensis TaxID=2039455 RepID=UPI003B221F74
MTSRQVKTSDDPELPATAWAVLGLLSFPGERSGYELKKWADASLAFFYFTPAISQIYAELRRLEARGYATSRIDEATGLRSTRRYAITPPGREALARWAAETDPGPAVLKHPLLLRVWLGHLAEPERLRAQLTAHMERVRAALDEIERAERVSQKIGDWPYPEIALRWSERRQRAELELAEAMLADLEELWGG